MTPRASSSADSTRRPGLLSWLLVPLSVLFPLGALLSYDWRSVEGLRVPAIASTNWIGALGDAFARYGYLLFGLAIWAMPFFAALLAAAFADRRRRTLRRALWLLLCLSSAACLLQVLGSHGGAIASAAHRVNIANPGGAIGYLLMTRCLSPLVSDFGSAVLAAIIAVLTFISAVGLRNLIRGARDFYRWATVRTCREPLSGPGEGRPATPGDDEDPLEVQYRAALAAKAAAREEKERLRAEKAAAKAAVREAARMEKERLRAEKAAAAENPRPPANAAEDGPAGEASGEAGDAPDKGPYVLPPTSLLNPLQKSVADHGDVSEMSQRLIDTLKIFGIDATLSYTIQGPVVTKYALKIAPGIRYSSVTGLQDNIKGALRAKSLRIEAPIPGDECVGIEVPNRTPAGITFREIIESDAWRNFKGELPLLFGKDAAGKELVADLASMPHMLVAGATGQGKSVCLNAIINGLLMTKTPEELKLIMVDPKSVEFTSYATLPHLIVPVITDNKKVVFSLHWAVAEMEKRLKLFARAKVRNIYDFNHRMQLMQTDMFGHDTEVNSDIPKTIPYIVIIIDEVADLMSTNGKEVTPDIARLTAKARAAGIHLILATQRPDAKIITGTIKANIPGRVAFKTATAIDSRTILDDSGAENLIGRGDMLFRGKDNLLRRAQGAWISDPEIANVISFIEQHASVQFDARFTKKLGTIKEEEIDIFADPEDEDGKAREEAAAERAQVKADANASDFKKAVECIINTNRASTSHFQRKLGWGYNHSAKIMDMLEAEGIIGPQSGAGPRQIIMDQDQLLAVLNGGDASEGGGSPTAAAPADDSAAGCESSASSDTPIEEDAQ